MTLGSNIKKLRTEKGLTQDQLGDLLGVKKSAIQKYESGTIENLKMATIEKLAEIFEVPPAFLVGWEHMCANDGITRENFEKTVNAHFGTTTWQTMCLLYRLNERGKVKVNEYVTDMHKIEEYRDGTKAFYEES